MRGLGITSDLAGLSLASAVAPGLPLAALQRIARQSLVVNPRLGLTGELRLERGRFALTLEGRADVLLPLAARILADRRHEAIRIAAFGAIAARDFGSWEVLGFELDESESLRFAAPERLLRPAPPVGALTF
jgi:hypothetical protein